MRIVIRDEASGKRYLIDGRDSQFEIFKPSKGKEVDGKLVGEGEWTTCRYYPTTLPRAVELCMNWILGDPDDVDTVVVEASKAEKSLRKLLKERVDKIVAEVTQEGDDRK